MAKSTIEERRLRRVGLAERAEELAKSRDLDADYAERGADYARAEICRAAAARHAASARQHRQEAARLAQRARAHSYRTDPAEKARQALAVLPAVEVPPSDCLDRYGAAMAEVAAIRAGITRLELALSELPRRGADAARMSARIETQKARALEWEREAARYAQASISESNQEADLRSGDAHSP